MRLYWLIYIFVFGVLFWNCKKDKKQEPIPPTPESPLIKSDTVNYVNLDIRYIHSFDYSKASNSSKLVSNYNAIFMSPIATHRDSSFAKANLLNGGDFYINKNNIPFNVSVNSYFQSFATNTVIPLSEIGFVPSINTLFKKFEHFPTSFILPNYSNQSAITYTISKSAGYIINLTGYVNCNRILAYLSNPSNPQQIAIRKVVSSIGDNVIINFSSNEFVNFPIGSSLNLELYFYNDETYRLDGRNVRISIGRVDKFSSIILNP